MTVIENAARERVTEHLSYPPLMKWGQVKGAGTEAIHSDWCRGTPWYDSCGTGHIKRAGTFMVAAAMTEWRCLVRDAVWEHNRPLISKLLEMGVEVTESPERHPCSFSTGKSQRLFM